MPEVKPEIQTFAKIKVIGIGGGGGSAINRMIQAKIRGVEFIAVNTDLQALQNNLASKKIHIGKSTTRGLGAGMNPSVGRKSAEEAQNELKEALKGADMVFITYGAGGGTGTGAVPKVAEMAKEMGALSVAVVTKPFSFEGGPRKKVAEEGFSELEGKVDTLITIPNDRIWQIIDKKTPLLEAFAVVDEVLRQGVQGVSELITLPGMINVDFADIKTIMEQSGAALMGMGEASGDNRAIEAAKAAVSSPLLELSVEGAKGILFTITGGSDLTMYEVSEAAKAITESVDSDARIIFGAVVNENLKDKIKITVVATGFDKDSKGYMSRSGVASRPGISGNQKPNYFSAKPWAQRDEKSESVNNKGGFNTQENTYKSENNNSGIDAKKLEQETLEPEKPEDSDRIDPKEVMPDEEKKSEGDDEDLEIPAFIRRKMM